MGAVAHVHDLGQSRKINVFFFFFFCFFNSCLLLGTSEDEQDLSGMPQSPLSLHPITTQRVVRTRGWTSTGDIVLEVCCRPPEEEEEVNKVFFRHLEESLQPPQEVSGMVQRQFLGGGDE